MSTFSVIGFDFRRWKKRRSPAASVASIRTPPTTPPAMAPTLVLTGRGEEVAEFIPVGNVPEAWRVIVSEAVRVAVVPTDATDAVDIMLKLDATAVGFGETGTKSVLT